MGDGFNDGAVTASRAHVPGFNENNVECIDRGLCFCKPAYHDAWMRLLKKKAYRFGLTVCFCLVFPDTAPGHRLVDYSRYGRGVFH